MAPLSPMPPISINQNELRAFGQQWTKNNGALSRTPPYSSGRLGNLFDAAVGKALAIMFGGIPIATPNANALVAGESDWSRSGRYV